MVGGFHASDGYSVQMAPPSEIILPDKNRPIFYVQNVTFACVLLILTNKHIIYLS